MDEWRIGVSSWIIQDGNYGDFKKGNIRSFAVEYYAKSITGTKETTIRCQNIKGLDYKVNGKVVFNSGNFIVIDIGILVYHEENYDSKLRVGSFIEGDFYLGIDPFFYFEYGYKVKNIPALIYQWKIDKIWIETAPFIESIDNNSRKVMMRDEKASLFKEIEATDAWHDDNGSAEYILNCTKLSDLSARIKSTEDNQ